MHNILTDQDTLQVPLLYTWKMNGLDDKKLAGAVLIDYRAAFDVIDHDILIAKLKCFGFSLASFDWIGSYLSNRGHSVSVLY